MKYNKTLVTLVQFFLFLFFMPVNTEGQGEDKSIVLLVDSELIAEIESNLQIFISDLEKEKYNVVLKSSDFQNPEDVRAYLKNVYDTINPGLIGAILIGDIPLARQYFINTYTNPNISPTEHNGLSTQFYSDLDGGFSKTDPDHPGSYNEHTGHTMAEIWVSVLPYYINNQNTINCINNYFIKNHEYRIGNMNIRDGYIEINEHHTASTENEYNNQIDAMRSGIYSWDPFTSWGNVGLFIDNGIGEPDVDYAYENEINSNKYKFAVLSAHGSASSNGRLTISDLETTSLSPIFIWLGGCQTGNLDYTRNIGTEIIYSLYSNALITKAGTSNVGGLGNNENGFYGKNIATSMLSGKSLGEAYLYHNNTPLISPWSNNFEMNNAPNIFFGDLSLTLGIFTYVNQTPDINKYFQLHNYPNPFSVKTILQYTVQEEGRVILDVYGIDGKKLDVLVNRQETPGVYNVIWNGTDNTGKIMPNGIYFARIIAGDKMQTVRMVLQR